MNSDIGWIALTVIAFFICLSFGNCDQSASLKRYKICMEAIKDPIKCDPYQHQDVKPTATPAK